MSWTARIYLFFMSMMVGGLLVVIATFAEVAWGADPIGTDRDWET